MPCLWFKIVAVGILFSLLVDGYPEDGYDFGRCRNFMFSTTQETYLPSEIINMTSYCNMTKMCPSWNIISQPTEIKILKNDTTVFGLSCTRNVSVQVVNTGLRVNRIQLLVDFINPRDQNTRVISVERSDDGGDCHRDEDCSNTDQMCIADSMYTRCSCPPQYVFVRNMKKCYPAVSRFWGQCTYSEQCRPSNSICKDSVCQCPEHHFPDEYFFNCLPEARGYTEECATDGNCQKRDINSWCVRGLCACKSNYYNIYGSCQKSGSSKISCGWFGILVAVFAMVSRI